MGFGTEGAIERIGVTYKHFFLGFIEAYRGIYHKKVIHWLKCIINHGNSPFWLLGIWHHNGGGRIGMETMKLEFSSYLIEIVKLGAERRCYAMLDLYLA